MPSSDGVVHIFVSGRKGFVRYKIPPSFSKLPAGYRSCGVRTVVNIAFNVGFGGVAAYSIGRLTWCFGGSLVVYIYGICC
jgi:hypothetical protein